MQLNTFTVSDKSREVLCEPLKLYLTVSEEKKRLEIEPFSQAK